MGQRDIAHVVGEGDRVLVVTDGRNREGATVVAARRRPEAPYAVIVVLRRCLYVGLASLGELPSQPAIRGDALNLDFVRSVALEFPLLFDRLAGIEQTPVLSACFFLRHAPTSPHSPHTQRLGSGVVEIARSSSRQLTEDIVQAFLAAVGARLDATTRCWICALGRGCRGHGCNDGVTARRRGK